MTNSALAATQIAESASANATVEVAQSVPALGEISVILAKMIAEKLEIDATTITPESNLKELGLDSLDTFDLIFNAEDHFDIKVSNDKVNIETLNDVAVIVHELIAAKSAS